MFVFTKGDARERRPGTWWRERDFPPGVLALTCCATCGGVSTLSARTHSVGLDGVVLPALICSHEGCSFHDAARLEGWGR